MMMGSFRKSVSEGTYFTDIERQDYRSRKWTII